MAVSLVDKTVLITGASSGIGEACVYAFAQAGAKLILLARRKERLDEIAHTVREQYGEKVLTLELDVRDREAVTSTLAHIPSEFSNIDFLINNAGLSRGLDPLQKGDYVNWEEMIDTNMKGLLWVTRAILPQMIEKGEGMIINIASIAGRQAYPNGNVYCASKAGVKMLSEALQFDVNGTGVRVTNIDPGLVETEFSLVRFRGDEERASTVYKGYKPMTGEDVAEAVLFCAARPLHVSIHDMLIMPTAQASTQVVYKTL